MGKRKKTQANKAWGGRFSEATDNLVAAFSESVSFDKRLYRQDIAGSKAHAAMLAKVGVLTGKERDTIVAGLDAIKAEIDNKKFNWDAALEDVHMNIEARLIARIGETGKKLHTGRSRNDQVATDLRLWLRDGIDSLCADLQQLRLALIALAEKEAASIMPGFTHLQVAQPVTFGHHMLAWEQMLARDSARLADCRKRVNIMPLGSAALAGTSYPVDRAYTAKLLGFDAPCENSLDGVSDRDFAIEFPAACAVLMMHLSRFSEELILWMSAPFKFIELPDRFCTGSSIMPQKKNPDVPELVRGKSGRVYGHLMALLTLMKGQPLAYNRDNQEDKPALFDTFDTASSSVQLFAALVPNIKVLRATGYRAAKLGFSTATDLADYLVKKGLAFRDAHEAVGKAVRYGTMQKKDLSELSLAELKRFSMLISQDVYQVLTLEGSVAARKHLGGTAPAQVRAAAKRARAKLNKPV